MFLWVAYGGCLSSANNVEEQPQRSAGRIIARNTLFGMGSQFALRGLGLVFNILVIRQLGDTQFGQYSVVLAWAGIFSFIGDLGIAQYMTREIARDKERLRHLFWNVTVLRFVLAILASVVTILGAVANGYESRMVLAIGLYTTSYFLQSILAPLQGVIAGHERLDVLSVFQVIGQIIFMAFGALFLFSGFDFVWLVIASLINLPVLIILSYRVIRKNRYTFPRFHIEAGTWLRLIVAGLPFAFIQLSLTTAYQFDRLILEPNVAKESIGWYSAAYTLTRAFLILTAAFSASLVLTLAREHAKNPEVVRPWYYRSVKFSIFLGLPLAVGGMLLADKIIQSAYGVEYAPAAVAFAILIWDTPLLMYTALGGNIATSIQQEGRSMRIYVAEAVLNILLNLYLIPRYGVIAACFTTVSTELLGAILFYVMFRREFGPGLGFKHIIRLVLAAVVMGFVVALMHNFHLLIVVGAGVGVYLLMVWALRALTAEERALLLGLSQRMVGKLGGRS